MPNDILETTRRTLSHFQMDGTVTDAVAYGNGHINDTYYATLSSGAHIILQLLNSYVFHKPVEVMENIALISDWLKGHVSASDRDLSAVLRFIPSETGALYYLDDDGAFWRAYHFIEGARTYEQMESTELFGNTARSFGAFFSLLADFPVERLHETIPNFHNTPSRLAQFQQALEEDVCKRVIQAQPVVQFVNDRQSDVFHFQEFIDRKILPLRVTHNDTKLNNVLISETTGRGVAVIDLDTVMPGYVAYDFGDAIRYGASEAAEDEPDTSKVKISLPKFKAYAEGFLARAGSKLTVDEIGTLVEGARIISLECGMRFFADYLAGDKYFRIHDPDQNLRRARVQFAMVADMEKRQAEMEEIVNDLAEKKIWE